ncbi:MAG: hypothetical protein ACRDFS_09780 [Chloroflexota bacterium]
MEARRVTFTPQELGVAAQRNLAYTIVGSVALLRAKGISVGDWARSIGTVAAKEWRPGSGALHYVTLMAQDIVASGGEMRGVQGDNLKATAVIVGWPPRRVLRDFGLSADDVDEYAAILEPVAHRLGYTYSFNRDADQLFLTLDTDRKE